MLRYIAFIILIGLTANAWAQPGGALPSDEVEVVKNFDARLMDAQKLNLVPSLPELDASSPTLNYNINLQPLSVEYPAPKIRPIAMKAEKLPEMYKYWAKLGFGYPISPLAELGFHSGIVDNYDFNAFFKHHSLNNNRQIENQRFGETEAKAEGTYYFDQGFAVSGDIGYSRDHVYFYGYDHADTSFTKEQSKQKFSLFEFGGTFFNSAKTQGDLSYKAGADFYRLSDHYDSDEYGINLNFNLTKWFSKKHELSVDIINDFSNFDQDTITGNLNNLSFLPSFTFHGDKYYAKAGLNASVAKDSFHVFPNLEAGYNVLGAALTAFVGWDGGLQKNSFRNVSDYNPFVQAQFRVLNTSTNEIYGGVKGQVSGFEYQAKAAYKIIKNLALYQSDYANDARRFAVIYDDVNIFNLHGELSANVLEKLKAHAIIDFNIFSPETQAKAWHLPALELNLGASYLLLEDKLEAKAELFVANGVPFLMEDGTDENLNGLLDLNLGAHYQINKNFGAFLDLNNVLNNKRQRWNQYPNVGINVMGGITARF